MPRRLVPPPEPTALEFHVALAEIEPAIWRRFRVPPDFSMWDLHVAIQDAMGWQDYHLHEFAIESAAGEVSIGIPSEDDFNPIAPGWEVPVALVFRQESAEVRYVYDFGDHWVHAVTLETIVTEGKPITKPSCLAGARACPPEDCGGPHGYMDLLEALRDPSHSEHRSMKAWAPRGFDPERFEPKKVKFDEPGKRLAAVLGEE